METLKQETEIKAIKEHTCEFCSEKIYKGQSYLKSVLKNDGYIYDFKSHKYCSELAIKLDMYDESCDDGLTGDAFMEYVSSFHDSLLINQLPKEENNRYDDIIKQITHVSWHYKLWYVITHFNKQQTK